jgi:Transglutaminase-like superfamily
MLNVARPPERRLIGVCRHFVVLLLTMLRAKHIPARCRCAFGSYFNPGFLEDHVVCEYWNAAEQRWVLVDAQFDEVWRNQLNIEHNILDVPHDRFLIAADAWARCRTGGSDALRFGIFKGNLRGLWFIAANLLHERRGPEQDRDVTLGRLGRNTTSGYGAESGRPGIFRPSR